MVRREHDAAAVGRHARIERAPAVAPPLATPIEPGRARLVRGQLEEVVEEEQVLVHVAAELKTAAAVGHERRRARPVVADHELAVLLARSDHAAVVVADERQRPLPRPALPVVDVIEDIARRARAMPSRGSSAGARPCCPCG